MLASLDQLDRWRHLLAAPRPAVAPDPAVLKSTIAAAHGRPLLIAAAAAADLMDDPAALDLAPSDVPPLPPVPVRRPAADGAEVADDVWRVYLRWRLGDAAAGDWLGTFVRSLDPTALVFGADDNPEPWWQNEMVLLHAAHSFALRSGDHATLDRTLACADFHLREIQPDHATNEPWAVHAYASHSDGNVTAETLLHAGFIQHGGVQGPVARHLCREASASLAAYLKA